MTRATLQAYPKNLKSGKSIQIVTVSCKVVETSYMTQKLDFGIRILAFKLVAAYPHFYGSLILHLLLLQLEIPRQSHRPLRRTSSSISAY